MNLTKMDWNKHAAYWDDFEEGKEYSQNIVRVLESRLDTTGLDVLDFGCGTGLLINHLTSRAKTIVGLDSAEKMIDVLKAKRYNNVEAIHAELSESTIQQNPGLQFKFDLIVAVSVCAFVPDYTETLKIIKTLLKPNGLFIQWDWLKKEGEEGFGFSEGLIRDGFTEAGLELESVSIPFYMMEKEEKMEVIMAIGK